MKEKKQNTAGYQRPALPICDAAKDVIIDYKYQKCFKIRWIILRPS